MASGRAGASPDGLLFGIHPGDKKGDGEPRGLIRIYSPVLPGGKYDLMNFIAIEPIVAGRRGFSEMERSRLDGVPGKRIWTAAESGAPGEVVKMEPGKITRLPTAAEQLELTLRVEKFDNGAHVYLVVTQRSDLPDEIELTVHTEPDSKPPQYVMLSATMGNKARTRLLWLADGPKKHAATLFRLFRRWFRGNQRLRVPPTPSDGRRRRTGGDDYRRGESGRRETRRDGRLVLRRRESHAVLAEIKRHVREGFAGGGQRAAVSTGARNCRFPAARPSRTSRCVSRSATASGFDSA